MSPVMYAYLDVLSTSHKLHLNWMAGIRLGNAGKMSAYTVCPGMSGLCGLCLLRLCDLEATILQGSQCSSGPIIASVSPQTW